MEADENDFKGPVSHLNTRWLIFCSHSAIRARKRKNGYRTKASKSFLVKPFLELR